MNEQEMINEVNRYAYQTGINPFGLKLKGMNLKEHYAEIQAHLAEREAQAAAFRAKMMALYA